MRRLAIALVVLLVAPAAALAQGAPGHELKEIVPYEVEAEDGKLLRGHVYLPDVPAPLATVLVYSPYYNTNPATASDRQADSDEVAFLVKEGFAVALVNVRGTGSSQGCLHWGDRRDLADLHMVIGDLAARPWSSGSVGMYGISYMGWMQDLAATDPPEALKAVVPMSGVPDVWSLLTRRGAPIVGGLGIVIGPYQWQRTGMSLNPELIEHASCGNNLTDWVSMAETGTTGDITPWFEARILRDRLRDTPVPMLRSNGLTMLEGHVLQSEGMWERLRPDRTRFILGHWAHEEPDAQRSDWQDMVVGWFDHYLRGGPVRTAPGVVEYQDDELAWHTSDRWPPPAAPAVVRLSGRSVVPDGAPVQPADQTFVSADTDPGIGEQPGGPQVAVTACGPHQALYVSPPLAEDALLAGNLDMDVTLSSSLKGGNFSVFLWKTDGSGACPDLGARNFARAMLDLRHYAVPGEGRDFPVDRPTSFRIHSHPFASAVGKGERLVVAVGGGNVELTPDPLHPVLTVHEGSLTLPVVEGRLVFEQ